VEAQETEADLAIAAHQAALEETLRSHRAELHRLRKQLNLQQVPATFLCPISQEIMEWPVVAMDGHTYERAYIEDWLRRGRLTSPTTNEPLPSALLIPNHSVRSEIQRFLDECRALGIDLPM
jgi:very-short-patch-repair endonuclease